MLLVSGIIEKQFGCSPIDLMVKDADKLTDFGQ